MRFLFSIFLLVLLSSCKKDIGGKKTVIHGKVYNLYTGTSVANLQIKLWGKSKGFLFSSADHIPIQTVMADGDVRFTFDFETEKNTDYFIGADGNSVYTGSLKLTIEEGKEMVFPVAVKPFVAHELRLKFEPSAQNKKIIINASGDVFKQNDKWTFIEQSIQMENYFFPVPVNDTTILFKGVPDLNNRICYQLVEKSETFPFGAPYTNANPTYFWLTNSGLTQNTLTIR